MVLEGARWPRGGLLDVGEELALARREGREEVEGGEAKDERLGVEERESGLDVKLSQGALAGEDLSDEGGRESEHGHPADEELVRLGEAESHGPDDVLLRLEELSGNPDDEALRCGDALLWLGGLLAAEAEDGAAALLWLGGLLAAEAEAGLLLRGGRLGRRLLPDGGELQGAVHSQGVHVVVWCSVWSVSSVRGGVWCEACASICPHVL